MRPGTFWFLIFAIGLGGLVYALVSRNPGAIGTTGEGFTLFYLVLVALFLGSSILGYRGIRAGGGFRELGSLARSAVAWIAIIAVLVLGYSYRSELGRLKDRLMGELSPASPIAAGPRSIVVRAGPGGHFSIDARVNGTPVRFLIDTGATDIVLSPADARRVGFDLRTLRYTRVYRTANGMVSGAPVILDDLVVGPLRFTRLAASVNGAPMRGSLLGISFLKRFRSYEVKDNTLTLRY